MARTRDRVAAAMALLAVIITHTSAGAPASAQPSKTLAGLGVREVTVFKDGHVFVKREGKMPVDARHRVVLDDLPAPVMGTFWPYSSEPDAPLKMVTASVRPVLIDASTLTLRERIELNAGGEAFVQEKGGESYFATVVRVTPGNGAVAMAAEGHEAARISDAAPVVYLNVAGRVRPLTLDAIKAITFKQDKADLPREAERNLLTLQLDPKAKPRESASVGMFYLQKGIRWIPSYRVDIDGKGRAHFTMQATLINELADLENARVNLVVGVPSFAFADTPDPMGVQGAVAQLSQHFRVDTRQALSNAIMTQARMGERRQMHVDTGRGSAFANVPELEGQARSEDLYVFKLEHVTLKRGERMVVPITKFELEYADVFKLDVPVMPPAEVWRSFDHSQQQQVARNLRRPKVQHVLRIRNTSKAPLTTAPALILREGTLLAQSLLAYTPAGAKVDLPVTAAIDVSVRKTEREVQRTPKAENWGGYHYARVNLTGKLALTNRRATAIKLEAVRHIVGMVDEVGAGGQAEMVNLLEADDYLGGDPWQARPAWWGWYNWPHWWRRFNGVGRFSWELELQPGESAELDYTWHYFWR